MRENVFVEYNLPAILSAQKARRPRGFWPAEIMARARRNKKMWCLSESPSVDICEKMFIAFLCEGRLSLSPSSCVDQIWIPCPVEIASAPWLLPQKMSLRILLRSLSYSKLLERCLMFFSYCSSIVCYLQFSL